jgi:PEP-CTERM motif
MAVVARLQSHSERILTWLSKSVAVTGVSSTGREVLMKCTRISLVTLVGYVVLTLVTGAEAASPFSNSLTGFTGDSTQAGTQAAVGAAGLNFFSTTGFSDNGTPADPADDSNDTIVFDAGGAHVGSLIAGDGGRNYMRTNDSDYATVPFQAEITFETSSDNQAVFFGVGAGDRALFGTPDWSTLFSSVSFWPETANDKFVRFRTQNDINAFGDTNVAGFDPGTHRFRMTFNRPANQILGEIDINYAGGPFVADAVSLNFPVVTTSLFGPDGWTSEPSRIFFGGDDGVAFRDLTIAIIPEPSTVALMLVGLAAMAGRRYFGHR